MEKFEKLHYLNAYKIYCYTIQLWKTRLGMINECNLNVNL